jgi:L-ascorbate metabolism protein UlaG (beta-lactamase superfamily)
VVTARLDWFGCATFRLRTAGGLTVFLDAYLDRVPGAAQSGFGVDDAVAADWILVGHSHFDHLYGAERIAARTGATVVGSYETVRILAAEGVPERQLIPVSGGERVALDATTTVRVLPSLHSCVWTPEPMPAAGQICLGDVDVTLQQRRQRLLEAAGPRLDAVGDEGRKHLDAADQGGRGDGGALIYVIETAEGSLLYQDTAGSWSGIMAGQRPDVAILAAAGRGNRDGQPVQGSLAEFVAAEAAALRPRRVVLSHHDDWLPGFSHPTDTGPVRAALAAHAPGTELAEPGYAAGFPVFGFR